MGLFDRTSDAALADRVATLERQVALLMQERSAHAVSTIEQYAPDPDADLRELIAAGRPIEAIRRYRERTGVGLQEAKDYVDRLTELR